MTRAQTLDAAVQRVADRMALRAFEAGEYLRLWLEDPEYLLPVHSIKAEFRMGSQPSAAPVRAINAQSGNGAI